jgi:hypothetical protein
LIAKLSALKERVAATGASAAAADYIITHVGGERLAQRKAA